MDIFLFSLYINQKCDSKLHHLQVQPKFLIKNLIRKGVRRFWTALWRLKRLVAHVGQSTNVAVDAQQTPYILTAISTFRTTLHVN